MLFVEMEEAKLGTEKPRALFSYTKLEMPLRSLGADIEQAMRYRDWSSGERSAKSREEILNSRVISIDGI